MLLRSLPGVCSNPMEYIGPFGGEGPPGSLGFPIMTSIACVEGSRSPVWDSQSLGSVCLCSF